MIHFARGVSEPLKKRLEATQTYRNISENDQLHPGCVYDVEHVRDHHGSLEAWMFRRTPKDAAPDSHLHITVDPTGVEIVTVIEFRLANDDRLRVSTKEPAPPKN